MKVYLDDKRSAPPGWTHTFWPNEVIALLETGDVTDLSLDHDLGDDDRGTGYDVILWVEEAVATRAFVPPPRIKVHSANPSARAKMELGIELRCYARAYTTETLLGRLGGPPGWGLGLRSPTVSLQS